MAPRQLSRGEVRNSLDIHSGLEVFRKAIVGSWLIRVPLDHINPDTGAVEPFVASQVVAGSRHSCALSTGGGVKCRGTAKFLGIGISGYGLIGETSDEIGAQLPYVDFVSDRRAISLTATTDYTCAILDDETLRCWGCPPGINTFNDGALGVENTTENTS